MSTKDEIKKIIRDYFKLYDLAAEASRNERMKRLAPGEPAPATGIIFEREEKEAFNLEAGKLLDRADNLINAAINPIKEKITKAPSTDAVNAISLIKLREDITKDELKILMEKYGDNYQAARAIESIAKQHDIYMVDMFSQTEEKKELEALEALKDNLHNSLTISAAAGGSHTMIIWLLETAVDKAITN